MKRLGFAGLVVIGSLGMALFVGAQERGGPRAPRDFGPFVGGVPGGYGRWASGIPACAQTKNCPTYQFTWTRKITRPVLNSPTSASPVTDATTGIVAGDQYGSTYLQVTVSPVGPWASKPGAQEFIYVRDLDTMIGYIQNVTRNTYESFPITVRTRPGGENPNRTWSGGQYRGPGRGGLLGTNITRKHLTNYNVDTYSCPDAEMTTITGPDTTTNWVFCNTLRLLVEEDSSGPRSSMTYGLNAYSKTLSGTLPFTPSGKLVEHPRFNRGHRPGSPDKKTPPPTP